MGLKQDIVVVNEFTVKHGASGSRGKSPGRYVMQYMLRKAATEPLSPVAYRSLEDFQMRYMLRESAAERAQSIPELKSEFSQEQGVSGFGFSRRDISLSDAQAKAVAANIQNSYEQGHTVQKIVLSFTEEFLRNNGIVSPGFAYTGRGSYRGNIDQLKLRSAIQEGLERMFRTGKYDDPEYMAVIQVDTGHVHCHIACTDMGVSPARIRANGEDKGMISEKEKEQLRRGIALELGELSVHHAFRAQVDLERRNVVSFVKDFAQKRLRDSASLQLLYASLPKDKRLWRYDSNRLVMRRPNEIATGIVQMVFRDYPEESGYAILEGQTQAWAKQKAEETGRPEREFYDQAQNTLLERTVNGIYSILRSERYMAHVRTSMIDIAKRDLEELYPHATGKPFDPVGFELRIRGYANRRDHHIQKSREFFNHIEKFYQQEDKSPDAQAVLSCYKAELLYHRMLGDKYRHFLFFNKEDDDEAEEEMTRLQSDYLLHVQDFTREDELLTSPPMQRATQEETDAYILRRYNIEHGSWYYDPAIRSTLSVRHEQRRFELERERDRIVQHAYEKGFVLFDPQTGAPIRPERRLMYEFDVTRALDLHDLTFDFPLGADVSERNIRNYRRMAQRRDRTLKAAEKYVSDTGQTGEVFADIRRDVDESLALSETLAIEKGIPPFSPEPIPLAERQDAPSIFELPHETDIVRRAASGFRPERDLE